MLSKSQQQVKILFHHQYLQEINEIVGYDADEAYPLRVFWLRLHSSFPRQVSSPLNLPLCDRLSPSGYTLHPSAEDSYPSGGTRC